MENPSSSSQTSPNPQVAFYSLQLSWLISVLGITIPLCPPTRRRLPAPHIIQREEILARKEKDPAPPKRKLRIKMMINERPKIRSEEAPQANLQRSVAQANHQRGTKLPQWHLAGGGALLETPPSAAVSVPTFAPGRQRYCQVLPQMINSLQRLRTTQLKHRPLTSTWLKFVHGTLKRSCQGKVHDTAITKLDHSSRVSEMADSIFESQGAFTPRKLTVTVIGFHINNRH